MELLELAPYWSSKDLSKRLTISRSTVQRCLEDLHRSGRVRRIHGGVGRINASLSRPIPLDERSQTDISAKRAIGQTALRFIGTGGYVYLDAGTTVLPLAQRLNKLRHGSIHFITNDVAIALTLARQELNHTLLSGRIHPVTQTISGPVSVSQITEYHFDVCFISADGIGAEYGITCSLNDEACLKRQAMRQSVCKVLLASSGKWERRLGSRIGSLENFDMFITEKATPSEKRACRGKGVTLVLADDTETGKSSNGGKSKYTGNRKN